MPGRGNAAFNNTLTGFGDSLAMSAGNENVGVHFYRNDIRMTGDDAYEGDYGVRNVTLYDNRAYSAWTEFSPGKFLISGGLGPSENDPDLNTATIFEPIQ